MAVLKDQQKAVLSDRREVNLLVVKSAGSMVDEMAEWKVSCLAEH